MPTIKILNRAGLSSLKKKFLGLKDCLGESGRGLTAHCLSEYKDQIKWQIKSSEKINSEIQKNYRASTYTVELTATGLCICIVLLMHGHWGSNGGTEDSEGPAAPETCEAKAGLQQYGSVTYF